MSAILGRPLDRLHRSEAEPERISILLKDDAAFRLGELRRRTGLPFESLIGIAIGLLEILVNASDKGRRLLLVSRWGIPLRSLFLPAPHEPGSTDGYTEKAARVPVS
jgi:hypothetical protein